MSEKNGTGPGKPDVAALRAEIQQTRAELGETVQALAAKADVKARARESVEQTKAKVIAQVHSATEAVLHGNRGAVAEGDGVRIHQLGAEPRRNPIPLVAVLAGVAAVVGVILIVRGRRR